VLVGPHVRLGDVNGMPPQGNHVLYVRTQRIAYHKKLACWNRQRVKQLLVIVNLFIGHNFYVVKIGQ